MAGIQVATRHEANLSDSWTGSGRALPEALGGVERQQVGVAGKAGGRGGRSCPPTGAPPRAEGPKTCVPKGSGVLLALFLTVRFRRHRSCAPRCGTQREGPWRPHRIARKPWVKRLPGELPGANAPDLSGCPTGLFHGLSPGASAPAALLRMRTTPVPAIV